MLLDTSFLIDLMGGDETTVEKAPERDLVQQHLSSMTLFELYAGIIRAIDSKRSLTVRIASTTAGRQNR
ncbi:hypothetical protein [Halosimplex amylolyticum]|uniref:hypothetical protein n=1 Tax=Halosimplex amylolyticum TaxID=3396616 RepID=UPI003F57FD6E